MKKVDIGNPVSRVEGKFTGITHEAIGLTSTYEQFVERIIDPTKSLYACPNLTTSYKLVPLNMSTPGNPNTLKHDCTLFSADDHSWISLRCRQTFFNDQIITYIWNSPHLNYTSMSKLTHQHQGKIIEIQVRRNAISITQLSRKLGVSRRSVYNWFSQDRLKKEVIKDIGLAIGHDFSFEFPNLAKKAVNENNKTNITGLDHVSTFNIDYVSYWKEKYLSLLEEHSRILKKHFELQYLNKWKR